MVRSRGGGSSRGSGRGESDEPEEASRAQSQPILLRLQSVHRSQALFENEELPPLGFRRVKALLRWDDRYAPYLLSTGFMGVVQAMDCPYHENVLRGFVERWREETHSFHLPIGEMTITLQDVSYLLGLPVGGLPVIGDTKDKNWVQIVEETLGVRPDPSAFANRSALKIVWLTNNFGNLPANADEWTIQCYVRAYILVMLGNVLLLDLSGDSVPCVYLPLLAELGLVSSYAWGAAILARLYRSLCHGARRASRQMAGPLLLLSFWILERFPDFRPFYTRRVQLPGVRRDIPDTLPPRGFHWSSRHDYKPVTFTLTEVRGLIDNMQEGHVIWMPYTPEIRGLMPPRVHVGADRWLYVGPLIDFAIVEMHFPDRVMRQFGLYQDPYPANTRSTWPELHDITRQKYPNCDWLVKHHDWIELWTEGKTVTESREFDIGMWDTYLQVYNLSTNSTFQSRVDLNFAPSRATQVRQRGESGIKQLV